MSAPVGVQITFGVVYVVGSILWPRVYYRRLDPLFRKWPGQKLQVRIIWAVRQGGLHRGPLWFEPLYDTWSWAIEGGDRQTMWQEGVVYVAWLLFVPVLCGLWPVAVFLTVFLATDVLSVLIAYPLLFLTIPLYTRYWSGKYEVPGRRPTA